MNNFDNFKSMNIDELVEWLDEYGNFEESPWMNWFNDTYCNNVKCPTEKAYVKDYGREMKFGWCELNGNCKFFPEFKDIPSNKEIIKMWLMLRVE